MSIIGTFTKQGESFTGSLRTLSINVKCTIVPLAKTSQAGPDYRVLAGTLEIGAAWKKTSKVNQEYLSLRIDDPMLPTAVDARLISDQNGLSQLYWSRRSDS